MFVLLNSINASYKANFPFTHILGIIYTDLISIQNKKMMYTCNCQKKCQPESRRRVYKQLGTTFNDEKLDKIWLI